MARAIVMLHMGGLSKIPTHLRGSKRTQAVMDAAKEATDTFPAIDAALADTQGRRLSQTVSHLGHIVVDATPAGKVKLEALPTVKAVMWDQDIHLIE